MRNPAGAEPRCESFVAQPQGRSIRTVSQTKSRHVKHSEKTAPRPVPMHGTDAGCQGWPAVAGLGVPIATRVQKFAFLPQFCTTSEVAPPQERAPVRVVAAFRTKHLSTHVDWRSLSELLPWATSCESICVEWVDFPIHDTFWSQTRSRHVKSCKIIAPRPVSMHGTDAESQG